MECGVKRRFVLPDGWGQGMKETPGLRGMVIVRAIGTLFSF
jgi:hypothetical protein